MGIDVNRVKLLCFDVDGTISDTDDVMVNKLFRLISFITRIFPSLDTYNLARRMIMGIETPANLVFSIPDRLGIDDEISGVISYFNKLGIGKRKPPFWLISGILPMLDLLAEKYPMAIVSARDFKGTMAFLDYFDLSKRFQSIVTAQSCEYTKPYPHPILHAAKMAGVKPEECLMIGDTTVDILSARKAGAQSIGVLCGFGEEGELRKAGADLILKHTSQVADALNGKFHTGG
jgi:phosphoglycolate phosphatase-like HAD superfamily hydrolase